MSFHIVTEGDINGLNYWKQLQQEVCDYTDMSGEEQTIFTTHYICTTPVVATVGRIAGVNDAQVKVQD